MIATYLPWLLSAVTIYSMWLAGERKSHTWLIGLANQALWLVWIVSTEEWGLLPMNLALWVVYGRNHLKWRQNDWLALTAAIYQIRDYQRPEERQACTARLEKKLNDDAIQIANECFPSHYHDTAPSEYTAPEKDPA